MADEVASAASLLMGQANEAHPVVVVSGLGPWDGEVPASALIRPASKDLFR
jgi:coenzyme F420-0:L-glutamate ligase/coenzyme F420-1:gamma-L-glutamate ligase